MESQKQSGLFTAYNVARGLARKGKLEPKRVNRALGIAQSNDPSNPYGCTATMGKCPDARNRPGVTCKHQIAAALLAAHPHP